MHAPARHLALVVSLALTGSVVHAAPTKVASRHAKKKVKPRAVVAPPAADEAPAATGELGAAGPRVALDDDPVTIVDEPAPTAAPARVAADTTLVKARPAPARGWQITVGPYLWASAVDANVSLGSTSVSAGVDFVPIARHAKYGAEVLAEARYGRLALTGDLMYGAVALNGQAGIGPVMASLTGNASSLLVDAAAGYAVAGDEHAPLSLEVRAGVRYQRTAVSGEAGLGGYALQTPESVSGGSDALVGVRGFVRPTGWIYLSGVLDAGVLGASNSTWSASADVSLRATSFLLISLGYRTMTLDRAQVSIVMHGPRAAVQLMF